MAVFSVDTSNYTTSVAVMTNDGKICDKKRLLPVKEGERGIRQSDAVFHHTKAYNSLVSELFSEVYLKNEKIEAVGASVTPTTAKGSYMPCFLVGESFAKSLSAVLNVPFFGFSHQQGHIAATLYSSGKTEYFNKEFIAFHVSGGTTDVVLCTPENNNFSVTPLCASNDLKAGQAVDRVGVKMGLLFPCGNELQKLAEKSEKTYKNRIKLYDGCCSFSGLENKCLKMMENGEKNEDTAKFLFTYIADSLSEMASAVLKEHPGLPLVFSGGVMSNTIIKNIISSRFESTFAEPRFSSDNAAGTAFLTFREVNG